MVPCTVASLTGLPSSLPSCMCPFPCQTVLSPLTLHRPLLQQVNFPSAAEAAPSFPASMPHRPAPVHITSFLAQSTLHCPLPHRTTIVPGRCVTVPSLRGLLPSPHPSSNRPPPAIYHHSFSRRGSIIPSPVHAQLSKRTTIIRCIVHAPWSLSPASNRRPFPLPKSLVPFVR